MGFKIDGPVPSEVRKFIPEFIEKGYDNLKSSDPITVYIRTVTERERRHLGVVFMTSRKSGHTGEEFIDEAMSFVDRVENLSGPNGPITTGADLAVHCPVGLLETITTEIFTAEEWCAEQKKTCDDSFDSVPADIKVLSGTVEHVPLTDLLINEDADQGVNL